MKRAAAGIRVAAALAAFLVANAGIGGPEDPPEDPDLELVEFLGSFDDRDDDWLAVNMEEMESGYRESGNSDGDDVETSDDQD